VVRREQCAQRRVQGSKQGIHDVYVVKSRTAESTPGRGAAVGNKLLHTCNERPGKPGLGKSF
jgi:hypothetical protein